MKILVTGATGNVGKAVVARLADAGHEVKVIGRRPDVSLPGSTYRQCDITDFQQLSTEMAGMDAVVHLAAFSGPGFAPPERTFEVNCQGTFNVYQAAANMGIARVISASSINALGNSFGVQDWPIHYLPVDEGHPTYTTDPYSFSKQVLESTAEYFWRRDGISGTCLRLPAVLPAAQNEEEHVREVMARCTEQAEYLLGLSPEHRSQTVAEWNRRLTQARSERVHERPRPGWKGMFPGEPLPAMRTDFWTSVDERDSAQAFEKSLTADYQGNHVLFINDDHNRTGVPSKLLADLFYPRAIRRKALQGTETLVSIDSAQELIGFEPEYSVGRYQS